MSNSLQNVDISLSVILISFYKSTSFFETNILEIQIVIIFLNLLQCSYITIFSFSNSTLICLNYFINIATDVVFSRCSAILQNSSLNSNPI